MAQKRFVNKDGFGHGALAEAARSFPEVAAGDDGKGKYIDIDGKRRRVEPR
jgi:hypothetical protein